MRDRRSLLTVGAMAAAILAVVWVTASRDAPPPALPVAGRQSLPPARPVPPNAPVDAAPIPRPEDPSPPVPPALPERAPLAPADTVREWVLRGTVRSTDGLPVEGATVTPVLRSHEVVGPDLLPLPEETVAALRDSVGPVVTDDRGRYEARLRLPRRSAFVAEVRARGFLPKDRQIRLPEPAKEVLADFELERATGIEGRVVDQEGAPVADASVSARSSSTGSTSSRATTGPDGRFRITDAPLDECTVSAVPPRIAPRGEWSRKGASRIARGGDRDVDLTLEWEAVTGAAVTVEVVDARTGERIVPKKAALSPVDGWYSEKFPTVPAGARIGPEGVRLDIVRPGAWRLWIETPGKVARHVDFEVAPGDVEIRKRIEVLPAGSIVGKIDFAGVPGGGGAQLFPWAELQGNGSFPQFALSDEETRKEKTDRPTGSAPAGADGSFRIGHLIPGTYRVSILQRGISAVETVEVQPAKEARVELRARRSATLAFRIDAPPWGRGYALSAWEEGGIRKPGRVTAVDGKGAVEVRQEVHPGVVHWLLQWTESADLHRQGLRTADEGTIEVQPGEVKEVTVPAPTSDQPQTPIGR